MQHKNLSKSSNDDQQGYVTAFKNLEHKIEDMFSHYWHNPFHHDEQTTTEFPVTLYGTPKMDVIDRDKEVIVKAELPGIDKEDIDVSLTNNRLFIKAKTCHEEKEEKGDYVKKEMTSSEFYRSVILPGNLDDSKIKTSFKNGMLELTIPKEENSHRRRIKIE